MKSFEEACNEYCIRSGQDKRTKKFKATQEKFWGADGRFQNSTDDELSSEHLIEALKSYFQQYEFINTSLIERIATRAPHIVGFALRSSEIFLHEKCLEKHNVRALGKLNPDLENTIHALDYLVDIYKKFKATYTNLIGSLKSLNKLDLVYWAGLFISNHQYETYISGMPDLGNSRIQGVQNSISGILSDLKVEELQGRSYTKEELEQYYKNKPNMAEEANTSKEQLRFNDAVIAITQFNKFLHDYWQTYSFDYSFTVTRKNNEWILTEPAKTNIEWEAANKKLAAESAYWEKMAKTAAQNKEKPLHMSTVDCAAFEQSIKGRFYLSSAYCIQETVISQFSGTSINTSKILMWFNTAKAILPRMKNHSLLSFSKNEVFKQYKSSQDEADAFIRQFSFSSGKSLFSHPIIRIGDVVTCFPGLLIDWPAERGILQNLLANQNKGHVRQSEVAKFEESIATYFTQRGFQTKHSTTIKEGDLDKPESKRDLAEIDILAYKDGHLFVLELKTTKLEVSTKEIYSHINTDLKKAKIQLDKIRDYIKQNKSDFIELVKDCIDLPTNFTVHSYIVDTTFEKDHEMFGHHLKLSHFELRTLLLNDLGGIYYDFPNMDEVLDLYPGGFNVDAFIQNINQQRIWQHLCPDIL